jgi:RNA methyltransferase, TrmH family
MITKSQVKYIQSLGQKKFRDETGSFVAEGPKIINELLGPAKLRAEIIYATREWMDANNRLIEQSPGIVHEVSGSELERCSFLTTPNQVLGIFKKPVVEASFVAGKGVLLMLDGIQDPGNMGSIIRIADWFGIQQIICSPDCADAFAPKVIQSTMASIARVQLWYTDLLPFIVSNKQLRLYAATLQGKPVASFGKLEDGVLVIGNESKGIGAELIALTQHQVTIPRVGEAESLNAAVATGIILSHLVE